LDQQHDVSCVAFSTDSSSLASGDRDGNLRIWDRLCCKFTCLIHPGAIRCVCYSPDGLFIATALENGNICLWGVPQPNITEDLSPDPSDPLLFQIAAGHRLLDLDKTPGVIQNPAVMSVAFSSDGKYLVSGDRQGGILVFDVSTRTSVRVFRRESINGIYSICFSEDGKTIAAATSQFDTKGRASGSLAVWTFPTMASIADPSVGDEIIGFLDSKRAEEEGAFQEEGAFYSVAASSHPDYQYYASGSERGKVILWSHVHDILICLKVMDPGTGRVRSLAFSPDSKILASASEASKIRLWSVPDGTFLQALASAGSSSVSFSSDGVRLASACEGTVALWGVSF
jgi:WD40 repeat protein